VVHVVVVVLLIILLIVLIVLVLLFITLPCHRMRHELDESAPAHGARGHVGRKVERLEVTGAFVAPPHRVTWWKMYKRSAHRLYEHAATSSSSELLPKWES
jgi:hypothetical protein